MITASGPTTHDMERMQRQLAEAYSRIDHLNRVLTDTERERDRYRDRATRGDLAYVAVREIAALLDTTSDEGLRTAIEAVVADTPPEPAPEPVKPAAEPTEPTAAAVPTRPDEPAPDAAGQMAKPLADPAAVLAARNGMFGHLRALLSASTR